MAGSAGQLVLRDEGSGKVLEVDTGGGSPCVRLLIKGDGEAFFVGELSAMLLVSTGRPWRPTHPGVRNAVVIRDGDRLVVRCSVGVLDAEIAFAFEEGLLCTEITWSRPAGPAVLTEPAGGAEGADPAASGGRAEEADPARRTGQPAAPLTDLAVGLLLELPGSSPEMVTLPQVLYRDNPSSDPTRTVPKLGTEPYGGVVVEEHRLPVPCVHTEWDGNAGGPRQLALYSLDPGDGSLGAVVRNGLLSLAALSGPVMLNGAPDIRYVHKGATAPCGDSAGYRQLGAEKGQFTTRHALDWGRPRRPGHGFRDMVHQGLRLYGPVGERPLSLDEIVRHKTMAMDRRWYERAGVAGYLKFPGPGHTPGFMYGWTGQCLKLAWCDARLGLEGGVPRRVDRCRRAVDFYLDGSGTGAPPGLRLSFHNVEDGSWSGFQRDGRTFVSARAYGDNLGDLADVIGLLGEHSQEVPGRWVEALREGADLVVRSTLPNGVLPLGWRLDGTPDPEPPGAAGLPCVLALLKTYGVTGDEQLLRHAAELVERYQRRHAEDFSLPFARATLDAVCEDKEAGIAFFLCAEALWSLTGEPRHREWAEAAADWLLTWVYQWNPEFPPGSPLRERGFSAVGWPGVSVQNHHLDVFFPAYELWRFGEEAGRPDYARLAELVLYAFGQGICTEPGAWDFAGPGEQGEGFYPTNWQVRGTSNTWNPSWVTAQVLSNALRMRGALAGGGR
ncbi:hypothetical protein ACH429_20450 [Streptomyces pathocidini]|uniref:Uncharacterized protein n=1 Tax=Streptomyces pathocidini TaxID=1650571 RepID=A0ABW7UYG2_9ACTN|nr:hypothetical protein [Streptomyces pathocidini]